MHIYTCIYNSPLFCSLGQNPKWDITNLEQKEYTHTNSSMPAISESTEPEATECVYSVCRKCRRKQYTHSEQELERIGICFVRRHERRTYTHSGGAAAPANPPPPWAGTYCWSISTTGKRYPRVPFPTMSDYIYFIDTYENKNVYPLSGFKINTFPHHRYV